MSLLVTPEELVTMIDDPSVVVVDASINLTRAAEGDPYEIVSGRDGYEAHHIPGAVFADFLEDFSDPAGEFMFTLPSPEQVERAAGALGIGDGVRVVVYTQELPTFAARFWWLLRYYGFETVSVLDGGLAAWRAAGLPVTDEPTPVPTPASFSARPRPELLARRADVEAVAVTGTSSARLVHALSTGEFHGDGLPEEARAGHIPGSVNIPWYSVIDAGSGRYLPAEQIKELLADTADGDDEVITYCGGGIAASMDAFALALAGKEKVRVYDGSLAEWSADPELPLTRD